VLRTDPKLGRAFLLDKRSQVLSPGLHFRGREEAQEEQCVMKLVGVADFRPGLLADALDSLGVEVANVVGGLDVQGTSHVDSLGAALL
jgi:hypothetical protein